MASSLATAEGGGEGEQQQQYGGRTTRAQILLSFKPPMPPPLIPHIEAYVNSESSAAEQAAGCRAIIDQLLLGRITINEVVTGLEMYLTTTDNVIRARGIQLLAEILVGLSVMPLEDTVVHSLTIFFGARLADWHSLRAALLGSLTLLRRAPHVGAVVGEDAREVARLALENLHVQALAQHDRMLCLEFFQCLLSRHGAAIAPLGGDLVFGVCAAIEEEKDPRCLLLVFRIVESLTLVFPDSDGPVADCAEDLFDIVSRYFPISFNPVSSFNNLYWDVQRVFACTPLFAQYCIPLLLEKLSSSLQGAKVDSLNYLGYCAPHYGARVLVEHAGAVWAALKAELLPLSVPASAAAATSGEPKDAEILEQATLCLTSWVETFQEEKDFFSHDASSTTTTEVRRRSTTTESGIFLQLILKDESVEDLIASLEDDDITTHRWRTDEISAAAAGPGPGSSSSSTISNNRAKLRVQATARVLAAAACASPYSCYAICSQVLTRIMGIIRGMHSESPDTGLEAQSSSLLGTEQQQNVISKDGMSSCGSSNSHFLSLQQNTVCFRASKSSSSRNRDYWVAIGLEVLASFPASLSPISRDQLQEVLSFLREVLLSGDNDPLQTEVLNALVSISDSEDRFRGVESSSVSTGILTEVIPYLLQAVAEEGTETVQLVEKQLIALQMIGGSRPIARKMVIEGLLTTVSQDLTQQYTNDGNGEWICGKVASVLHCLSNDILPRCDSSSDTDQASAAKVALEIWTFLHSSQPWVRANEQVKLLWSMEAMRVAVQKCNIITQKKILQKGSEILFSCRSEDTRCTTDSSVQEGMEKVVETAKSQATCVDERGWVVGHLAAVVVSLIPSTDICNERVLLEEFVGVAIHGQSPLLTEVAAHAVASMLNKWEALHLHLEDMIHLALDKGWFAELPQKKKQSTNEGSVANDTKDVSGDHVQRRVRAICAIAWAGKGLAMRGHSRVADVASLLITLLLSGTPLADPLAFCVGSVLQDREEDGSVRMAAAQGFSIIVEDSPVCLNKAHHAVIRPLFKQRFFHSMITPLMEAMQKASAADVELSRLWLYRGLAHLVSGIPHSVVLTDGEKAFPLLLGGISTLCTTDPSDSESLLALLLAVSGFLVDDCTGRPIAAEHVSSLVKRLLVLVQYEHSPVVRKTALQCLGAVVGLPYAGVFPLRREVLKALLSALDDRKRVVRKEAVRCRQAW
ncbi:unnamed protein product [Sphagnum troendelagicum]|uniref:MMS19 nucleotide excision repair protein n=1 Tax=Sphagnum troendelagicum TaxID=128251 RepID=A0ABP0UZC4_9BRYO